MMKQFAILLSLAFLAATVLAPAARHSVSSIEVMSCAERSQKSWPSVFS